MSDLLAEARREILSKSCGEIERETAFKWAARAVAAYTIFRETRLHRWLRDSERYLDEAFEHAALQTAPGRRYALCASGSTSTSLAGSSAPRG